MRPIAFVDVDGVLSPDDRNQPGFTVYELSPGDLGTYKVALNPEHGRWLLELAEATGAELVWGTTWSEHANELIGPRVGLPELAYVEIPPRPPWGRDSVVSVAEWKARRILDYAAGRPFVWLDDEPDAAAEVEQLKKTKEVGACLVVEVDALRGLQPMHVTTSRYWLAALSARTGEG